MSYPRHIHFKQDRSNESRHDSLTLAAVAIAILIALAVATPFIQAAEREQRKAAQSKAERTCWETDGHAWNDKTKQCLNLEVGRD